MLLALESDPSLHRHTTFPVLDDIAPQRRDCFAILAGGEPAESLWLAQTVFAVVTWMQGAGFTGHELTDVLGGRPDTDDESRIALVDGITAAFEQVAFAPSLFVGGRFGERAAKIVHDVLTAYENGVVSAADDRLLRLDPSVAVTAAYDAVTDFGVIVSEDFLGLGLSDHLQEKVFGNLVLLGYLRADGTLVAETVEGLEPGRRLRRLPRNPVQMIGQVVNGTASFFPSDLAALDHLTPAHQAELYDNLLYHGYLDEDGNLVDADFFLEPDNLADFEVNVDLADAAVAVTAFLDDRTARFTEDPLALDPDIFAELRLTEDEQTALVESLTFNGYLDENGDYRDKATLATLPLADFGLALPFYPRRRAILDAVQGQILEFRAGLYTVTVEDFAGIADDVVSRRVVDALEGAYTERGRVLDEDLFADPAGYLELGGAFTESEQEAIFRRIGVVLADERPYRLAPAALTDLGLTGEERDRLLSRLTASGYLIDGLAVAGEWLPYFRNVGNAYDFTLPGFEDYRTDVFFLLHAVAGELAAAVTEVGDLLAERAEQQRQALYGALADTFGIPVATAAAICEAVTGGPERALDVLVAPVLDSAGPSTDPRGASPRISMWSRDSRRRVVMARSQWAFIRGACGALDHVRAV